MKKTLFVLMLAALLNAGSALAIAIDAQVEGPLLNKDRVLQFVKQNLEGALALTPDLAEGGKHRLFVRVASKHIGPGSWFLYLTEIQLQRQVTDAETRRVYWASIRSAVLWGTVPSETEVREALGELMAQKVKNWEAD